MGVCTSTNKMEIEQIEDENCDYEKVREDYRDKKEDDQYEVEAKLYEYVLVNSRMTRKSLISKYLFFNSNGRFTSYVSKNGINDILIEGSLNPKTKILTLQTKQQLVENNAYRIRLYSGKFVLTDQECIVKGKVIEDGQRGKQNVRNTTFEINFTTSLWRGLYSESASSDVILTSFIKYHDFTFTGIGSDSKGISVYKGYKENLDETNADKNKYIIEQVYIFSDGDEKGDVQFALREKNTYKFVGKIDDKKNTFEGVVSNKNLENNIKFSFKFAGL
jgi:hypothetical protein